MVDEELRQGLMKLVALVGIEIAQGAPAGQILQTLEDGTAALEPVVEAFRRADAEQWLEAQARTLKPRKPRTMSEKRQRMKELRAALGIS